MHPSPVTTPWSELEARLTGPQAKPARLALVHALQTQAEALNQRLSSMSLGRSSFAIAEAYADAVEAALGFLHALQEAPAAREAPAATADRRAQPVPAGSASSTQAR